MKPLIRTRHYQITVPVWQNPGRVRLAVLADLHNNIYPGLPTLIEEVAPDYVLIAGDMINRPTDRQPPRYTRGYGCIGGLAKSFPVIYAPGNHESTWKKDVRYQADYSRYRRGLEKKGVIFLDNCSIQLGDDQNPLGVAGVELSRSQFTHHRRKRLAPTPELIGELLGPAAPYQLLLAHNPDYLEVYAAWGADLVLSGHYHGGQFRLPFLGGLIGPGFQVFPHYTRGLYQEHDAQMIVSAGLGTHTFPFRGLNPRELVLVDLVKE